uniref:HEAT repeat domain-containing protein n=1 Tax=Roseihalotalea indica TaxID=2867963 RepID=A0AA49PZN7_9BACT|nr:hypothetical protein K4G66_14290 [Tunicatimonas sp. TK19036]
MSNWMKLLSEGPPLKLGKTDQIVYLMEQDPETFDKVFATLFQENLTIKIRAANAVEKVTRGRPEWLLPHQQTLLANLSELAQPFSVKMATAALLGHATWTDEDVLEVLAILRLWLLDTNTFVKVNCLQALTQIAQRHPWLTSEVIGLIENEMAKGKASIKARGRKLLKQLNAM